MKKISFLPLLAFIIFLSSCEYQTSEVYNRPVNRNIAPPNIQVVELNIDEDTLIIYWSMEIKFKFHSDNQAIKTTRFLIDGKSIGTVESDTGSFTVSGTNIEEGLHVLTVEICTASGTGSLADDMGAETFVSSQSWKLVISKGYYAGVKKTVENGLLHIKWNPYYASNFKEYIICKWGEGSWDYEITKVGTCEYIDSSYVGEWATYSVSVNTEDDIISNKYELNLASDLPAMFFGAGDSNYNVVKWNRSKYYNAVDSFLIFQGNEYDVNYSNKVKSTHNINDTTYRVPVDILGDPARFKLRVVPKKNNIKYFPYSYSYFESQTGGILGFAFKTPDNNLFCRRLNNDEFIYYDCDVLSRYSISQHRTVDNLLYQDPDRCNICYENIQVSNSGKFITSYVGCRRDLLCAKGVDIHQYSVLKLQNITGGNPSVMAVSDAGTAIIGNSTGGFNLVDLVTFMPIGFYERNYEWDNIQTVKISPTGEYFFVYADTLRLLQLKNGEIKDIWKANPGEINYYNFDSDNPDRLVIWNGSKLSIRSCSDFSLVSEYSLSDASLIDIDYTAGEILTYSDGHFYVRSLSDGSLVKDVPINVSTIVYENCCLVNHTIVVGQGFLYFI